MRYRQLFGLIGIEPLTVATLPRASAAETVHIHVPCSVAGGPAGLAVESVAELYQNRESKLNASSRVLPEGLDIEPDGCGVEGFSSAVRTWMENAYSVPAPTLTA